MSGDELGAGARPKTYSFRKGPRKDYAKLHEGHPTLDDDDSAVSSPIPPLVLPEREVKEKEGATSKKTTGNPLAMAEKEIEVLDREIIELETSIIKAKSCLKEVSVRKERKERSDRVAKLRRELFVAEQQLQKAEEEGEIPSQTRKHVTLSKKAGSAGDLAQTTKVVGPQTNPGESLLSGEVNLHDLRLNSGLVSTVNKKLSSLGLVQSSDSDDSESSCKDLNVGASDQSPKASKPKKCKSGLYKKSSDSVLFPQLWPHTALQYEYVSDSVEFMSLDIKMFVAGEIEIILGSRTPSAEKAGRLRLLRKLMYFAGIYKWSALLRFYAAWVRKIEVGLSTWSDDSSEIETPMLARYTLSKSKGGTTQTKGFTAIRDSDQVWWCPDYNKQQCSVGSSSHQKYIKNQMRTVKHICSVCLKTDKKQLEHPKISSACPYKK